VSASGRGAPHRAFAAAIVGLVVALMATFVTTPARAAGSPATLAIDEAKRARLAESAEWRRLLHVHRTAGNGLEAEPDGPEFYLSPRGVFDPEAELEATIGALYAPASLEDSHALCKFPARARFLGGHTPGRRCTRAQTLVHRTLGALVQILLAGGEWPPLFRGHPAFRLQRRRL